MTRRPAAHPCGSCPYRRDVPSGVWDADEYAKLEPLDDPAAMRAFMCHQQDGRLCAGWVAVVDAPNSIGLRLLLASGSLDVDEYEATLDYETTTPHFASGAEAAEHGLREHEAPGLEARYVVDRLKRKRRRERGGASRVNGG